MSDDHKKHLDVHVAVARRYGKSNVISYEAVFYLERMTVTEWLSIKNISEDDALAYPNARTALDIRNSPLGKALE